MKEIMQALKAKFGSDVTVVVYADLSGEVYTETMYRTQKKNIWSFQDVSELTLEKVATL